MKPEDGTTPTREVVFEVVLEVVFLCSYEIPGGHDSGKETGVFVSS